MTRRACGFGSMRLWSSNGWSPRIRLRGFSQASSASKHCSPKIPLDCTGVDDRYMKRNDVAVL